MSETEGTQDGMEAFWIVGPRNPRPECPGRERHCPHPSGMGTSYGRGGETTFVCCFCGAYARVGWHDEATPIEGHGPHHTAHQHAYDWPEGWAPSETTQGGKP